MKSRMGGDELTPSLRAASDVPDPYAQASTIAARSAWPAETVLDRIHVVRVERSSSLTVSAADGMCPSFAPMSTN